MHLGVDYNKNVAVGAAGPSVWAKLGPERWFPQYRIVCANGRDFTAPYVIDMGISEQEVVDFLTTQSLLDLPQFATLANGQLANYRFVVYRPVHTPSGMSADRFIANDSAYSRYENKRVFREMFHDMVAIPEYRIIPVAELLQANSTATYEKYAAVLGNDFVMQDELGGGGRGTHMVSSAADMHRVQKLLQKEHKGTQVIISRRITGIERSMQACVTEAGVVLGPVQQQLVRNPELLNVDGREGMHFCGGRLVKETAKAVQERIEQVMHTIGDELQRSGYRGIFGVDFLVDASRKVYAIEINARTTGLLPLINEQHDTVPLYLLHILELAGEPYTFTNAAKIKPQSQEGPQSFVVLFNKQPALAYFDAEITTGNYQFVGGTLQKMDDSPRWTPGADVMLQLFCSPSFRVKPNHKLCNIFLKNYGFDDDGNLRQDAHQVIAALQKHIVAE